MEIFSPLCYNITEVIFLKPEFEKYMNLLLEWNEKINLTAITQPDEVKVKHFEDSLTCLKSGYIKDGDCIVDVGTGAGFPGLPIKIENNSIKLTLMDSLNKRINFLKEVSSQLNLDTECIHIRAEEAGKNKLYRGKYDVAVSRAVARLSVLAEYCLPLVKKGGYMLAMKGKDVEAELEDAKPLIKLLGGQVKEIQLHTLSDEEITHSIVVIEKIADTNPKYPRNGKKVGTV